AAGLAGRVVEQVFLGHRATAAGALDRGWINAFLRGGETRPRGQVAGLAGRDRVRVGRGGRRGFGLRRALALLDLLVAGGALVALVLALARVGRLGGAFLDDRQQLLAGHRVAFVELDLLQHAVDRRRDLEHDLVGLQVDEVLVAADGVPDLLVPAGDGGVGHGFGKDGDLD